MQDGSFRKDDFYEPIIDAGRIDGKQYILPLSFALPMVLNTKNNLQQAEFSLEEAEKDLFAFQKQLTNEKMPEVKNTCTIPYIDMFSKPILDYETGKTRLEEETIIDILKLAKQDYPSTAETKNANADYYNMKAAEKASCISEQTITLIGDLDCMLPNGITNTAIELERMGVSPILFPMPNEIGEVTANVENYAAIRSNSENKWNAFQFIKYILTTVPEKDIFQPSSFSFPTIKSKEILRRNLEVISDRFYQNKEVIPETIILLLTETFEQIDCASIQQISYIQLSNNRSIDDMFYDYYNDIITLEELIQQMEEALEFYWNE